MAHDEDAGLASRALQERWEVSPAMRAELIAQLYKIATSTDPAVRTREKASAIRALFAASKHNLEMLRTSAAVSELDALMARLDHIEAKLDDQDHDD